MEARQLFGRLILLFSIAGAVVYYCSVLNTNPSNSDRLHESNEEGIQSVESRRIAPDSTKFVATPEARRISQNIDLDDEKEVDKDIKRDDSAVSSILTTTNVPIPIAQRELLFADLPNAIRSMPESKYRDESEATLKESFCGGVERGFPPMVCQDVAPVVTPACTDQKLVKRYCETNPKGVPAKKSRMAAQQALTMCKSKGYQPCKSWSQQDEDMVMFGEYYSEKHGSQYTYLELGALDGVEYSNTKFYEDTMGWHGILIEAARPSFELLRKNRGHDRNALFNLAVCENPDIITFTGADAGAGVLEHMSKFGYEGNKEHVKSQVRCERMGKILHSANVTSIDMWSLDVEGFELYVLRSMDWEIPVHVINIERNPRDRDIETLLISKGFRYSREQRGNRIWVNDKYEDAVKALGGRKPISTGARRADEFGSIV
eukprot:m.1639518 g.1639518  ORF g.1639518 m.1639518 type:complete len:432 (-) comp36280_c0_seq1:43-1338(-)